MLRRPSSSLSSSSLSLSSSTIFKCLLLWNRLTNQSQILCGASLRRENESLFKWSRSHNQDGLHAHIWLKTFKNLLLQNQKSYDLETWLVALATQALQSLYKWWPWVDLDLCYGKVKFGNLGFSIGKSENCWFSRTIATCDLKPTEKMNICVYWRSRSFLDLGPRSLTYKT